MRAIFGMPLVLLTLTLPAVAADQKLAPAAMPLPVLAWGGLPSDKATVERYRELAEAGFTINFSGFGDVEAALKGLDLAQAAGVKLMISCAALKKDPAGTVARVKSHPALAGYYLRDEPPASAFPELAAWEKQLQTVDPDHFTYINLFPNYANSDQLSAPDYQQYLDRYMRTVPARLLSFDHYPVIQGPKEPFLRGEWYDNLERISAAARKAQIPFWAFALSTKHFSYPAATVANLRCQIFSDLAYGAQGLQYFTYWQITGSSEGIFTDAPIAADGKRTAVYDRVKQINAEARGLWPVFANAKMIAIAHSGDVIPAGTRKYEPQSPVKSLIANGAVVSRLRNGDREFLVLVNRDINHPLPITVEFDRDGVQRVEKDATLQPVRERKLERNLEPGDIAVLTWPTSP